MAQRVVIPRLGQTMTEGTVVEWLKKDGDTVDVDDGLYELEYDKANSVVQARKKGVLRHVAAAGDTVPVGQLVGVVLEDGETLEQVMAKEAAISASAAMTNAKTPGVAEKPAAKAAAKPAAKQSGTQVSASPMVKRLAAEHGIDIADIQPKEPGARLTKEDVERYIAAQSGGKQEAAPAEAAGTPAAKASPMAKRIAAELGVDISMVTPADGIRITQQDVQAYAAAGKRPADPLAPREGRREKMRGMRKAISERMQQSYFTCPTVTLTTDADMAPLMDFRAAYNKAHEAQGSKLSVTDVIVAAVAKALKENEIINASVDGDEIVYHADVNVGIAVALDEGLVVPVVRGADTLGWAALSAKTRELVSAAREGTIEPDALHGGTFTVTNLGTAGIDAFNPIINFPESAILGVGRTVEKPVVENGKIGIGKRAVLSLTHDHRIIDGAPAAKFLQAVVGLIEDPDKIDIE